MKEPRIYNGIERPEFTPERISELKADEVFVFGSNLARVCTAAPSVLKTCACRKGLRKTFVHSATL